MGCAILFSSFLMVSTAGAVSRIPPRCQTVPATRLCAIHFHHRRAEQLRVRMGLGWQRYRYVAERSPARRDWLVTYWMRRHRAAARAWHRYRSVYSAAERWAHQPGPACITSHEGSDTSVNPAGPYYGRWQADRGFEAAYNPRALSRWGDANHWPRREQDLMAYHGYEARGYAPWPNTAAMCGL